MFFKKFKNLKLEPKCTSGGYIILYTRSLTTITLGEAMHITTKRQVTKTQMYNKQTSQLTPTQATKGKWERGNFGFSV
jgi:hypothetical protein